uniref:Crinkler (CRN) family protein n=1 Tax=Globodera pallida TaxID=36090 RepID=A0A183BLT7_GLOPA
MATTSQSNALETPVMVTQDTGTKVTVFISVPGMRKKSGLLFLLKRWLRLKSKSPFSLATNVKFGQYALTDQSLKLVAEVYPDKAAMHKRSEDHTRYECNIEQFPSQINAESATFDVEQTDDSCYIVLSCMKTDNYSTNWKDFMSANGTLDLTKA